MKRLIFFFFVLLPMMVAVQNDIKLYDELCEPLQAVFCDYVKEGEVKYISTPDGQYVRRRGTEWYFPWYSRFPLPERPAH